MRRGDISRLLLTVESRIQDAVACIDRGEGIGIALLVDDRGQLVNTITDGDVRRGILAGLRPEEPVAALLRIKSRSPIPKPVTASVGSGRDALLALMREKCVRQIPLIDSNGMVEDVAVLDDLLPEVGRTFEALIMAGGLGTRLRPLTEDTPKPMLRVGERPLMEVIIARLREAGVRRVHIATHFRAEKIIDHFRDGKAFGVDIDYLNEATPLGTGGALSLLSAPENPLLVMNGDILTEVDLGAMYLCHQDHRADMTVAVRRYEMKVPYGVLDCEGDRIVRVREKPVADFLINAGIYLLERTMYEHVAPRSAFNMTDLIALAVRSGKTVVSFPIREYWLDIGQTADYQKAQDDARAHGIPNCA